MKKRLFALLTAAALFLTSLTGCASSAVNGFYETVDEMTQVEDAQIDLVLPYHGAKLLVNGSICRSNQTADLTFTLEGTGEGDGIWTEVRINGNQIWLNVAQLAQRTLAFGLSDMQRFDIEDLQSQQTADWVNYPWQGDLWSGIPNWGELLSKTWEDSRKDLKSHITAQENVYTLDIQGKDMQTAVTNAVTQLIADTDSYREGILTFTQLEQELILATQLDFGIVFDDYWYNWTDILLNYEEQSESGEAADGSLALTLTKGEDRYEAVWVVNGGEEYSLTLTPIQPQSVEEPEHVMDFGAYDDCVYYLADFSNTYIGDALDGTTVINESQGEQHRVEEETPIQMDMDTDKVVGFADLATVSFIPDGGTEMNLPILTGYLENSATSSENDESKYVDLSLSGSGWYQSIYSEQSQGRDPEVFLYDDINSFYEAYIDLSGYLLIEDLSAVTENSQGVLAQGFSYREDNYSDPVAQILIVFPQEGCPSYAVLDLELRLAELSQEDKNMVEHLFAYLNLELPISLEAE